MGIIRIISRVRRERGGRGANVFLTRLGYSGLMKLERILMKEFLDLSMFGTFLCMPFKLILILSINTYKSLIFIFIFQNSRRISSPLSLPIPSVPIFGSRLMK